MTELNLYVAPVCDFLRVVNRFLCIREEFSHLLFALDIELPAGIPQAVLVAQFFSGLQTKQDVVCFHVVRACVMDVVCGDKRDVKFSAHFHEFLVNLFLVIIPMVLKFQKEITFTETLLKTKRGLFRTFDVITNNVPCDLSRQTCRRRDKTFMKLFKKFHVNPRLIVKSFCKRTTYHLRKVRVSFVVLRKKNKVIIFITHIVCFLLEP